MTSHPNSLEDWQKSPSTLDSIHVDLVNDLK